MSDTDVTTLLADAAARAARYLSGLRDRPVAPAREALAALGRLAPPLPERGLAAGQVLALLDEAGSPATLATAGPRFFGFVIGGSLPATVAASVLGAAWDQNAGLRVTSPVAAALEDAAIAWLLDVLALPSATGVGFVTCATTANLSGLAAARHALLARQGWNVEANGLFGAPPLRVVVGDEVHVSVLKALSLLGFGSERVERVRVDDQGRMRADAVPRLDERTILCLQAGNVNTGAFDPAGPLVDRARAAGAWVHVDGAFGLWARAAPSLAPLAAGLEGADSWATDAHKWLNVPYDSGLVFCRDAAALRAAMRGPTAAYLTEGEVREPDQYVPEFSRRARGLEVWAALLSLGRVGLRELLEGTCAHARRFALGLSAQGHEVLNEVVLNQVLVSFGPPERTRRVIREVQEGGVLWCSGTTWQGRTAMRISVSNWATTADDVEKSLEGIRAAAARVP
ncbi:MAG TPA: pyridoxal-dependent decarboxylase [Vicinamibacteria bacterium]|nr:pyridoxal-dependent decarboxylase [Vicinamibacteria bacterium]